MLRRLATTDYDIVAVSRRVPERVAPYDRAEWLALDLVDPKAESTLAASLRGVDAVVHLAWLIQPGRDREALRDVNQGGTRAVVGAVRQAGVRHLVHMSSVGAYSPVRSPGAIEWADESWPTGGVATSSYSVDKAAAERIVDELTDTAVTRVRPALILQPDAASEISRYFLGRLVPLALVRPAFARLLPWPRELRLQFVHADDVADALLRILETGVTGGVNLASTPMVDRARFAQIFGGVTPPLPLRVARGAATATWRAHLQPTDAGWLDLGTQAPLLDTHRARTELGWTPAHSADDLLADFVAALQQRRGGPGPLLKPRRPS